ncbi:MAG: hypothetical protein FJW20_27415 [Acidimicrobiia bacterium]|nr:hypothetical protein [Acidimicrobiia bacterium]
MRQKIQGPMTPASSSTLSRRQWFAVAGGGFGSLALGQSGGGQALMLAEAGRTSYLIVAAPSGAADGIEDYAAKTLAVYLTPATTCPPSSMPMSKHGC